MATQPSTVTLKTGDFSVQTFNVESGVTKLSVPLTPGGSMYGKIERDGATIVELDPEFTFDANPTTYNFNAFVASAQAPIS
jgi:glucan endo-1,3-alpha-glucosidase